MTASHTFAALLAEEKPEVITPLDLGESSLDLEIPTHKEARTLTLSNLYENSYLCARS